MMALRLAELGASWREELLEVLWGKLPRGWDAPYDVDARHMLDQALSRLLDGMTAFATVPITELRTDGRVSIMRVPTELVEGRGDFRYRSDNLAAWLRENPERDLVPIVCSRTRSGYRVLDGHHRLRAYQAVGREPLAVVVSVRPGTGLITI